MNFKRYMIMMAVVFIGFAGSMVGMKKQNKNEQRDKLLLSIAEHWINQKEAYMKGTATLYPGSSDTESDSEDGSTGENTPGQASVGIDTASEEIRKAFDKQWALFQEGAEKLFLQERTAPPEMYSEPEPCWEFNLCDNCRLSRNKERTFYEAILSLLKILAIKGVDRAQIKESYSKVEKDICTYEKNYGHLGNYVDTTQCAALIQHLQPYLIREWWKNYIERTLKDQLIIDALTNPSEENKGQVIHFMTTFLSNLGSIETVIKEDSLKEKINKAKVFLEKKLENPALSQEDGQRLMKHVILFAREISTCTKQSLTSVGEQKLVLWQERHQSLGPSSDMFGWSKYKLYLLIGGVCCALGAAGWALYQYSNGESSKKEAKDNHPLTGSQTTVTFNT